jgi:hypothetical protein
VWNRPKSHSRELAVLLALVLGAVALALPLTGNDDHAAGHLAFGIPVVLLLVLAVKTWPVPSAGRAALVARNLLLAGLALFVGSLLIEAVGAYGVDDRDTRINGLAVVHDVAVFIGPLGIALTIAGVITSIGVALAARRGAAESRYVTAAVVLATVAIVAFVAGGVVFGY